MKDVSRYLAPVTVCAMLALPHIAAAQTASAIPPSLITPDKVETRIGPLQFKDGAPSVDTAAKVYDALDFTRGLDAFLNSYGGASAYAIRSEAGQLDSNRARQGLVRAASPLQPTRIVLHERVAVE